MRLPKRFRSRTRWFLIFYAIVPLGLVAAVVGATGGAALAVACGLLPLVLASLLAWRASIEATADGLVLHDVIQIRRIPWNQVDHIELSHGFWTFRVVTVIARNGSRIKSVGLGVGGWGRRSARRSDRHIVDELNRLHSEALSRARPT
jgi:hypothetical protein